MASRITEYFTSTETSPVREIAEASRTGPATVVLSGTSSGLESSVWAIIAIAIALQPASRLRKLYYVLPVYLLGFTLIGAILGLLGIGTVGPFITVWLAGGGVLSMIAVITA